jgi:hypothetical protein
MVRNKLKYFNLKEKWTSKGGEKNYSEDSHLGKGNTEQYQISLS